MASLLRPPSGHQQLTGFRCTRARAPMLTHQRPGRAAAWLDDSRVHHDRINALRETREVTAYLSTVDEGGTRSSNLRRRVDGAMDGEARAADARSVPMPRTRARIPAWIWRDGAHRRGDVSPRTRLGATSAACRHGCRRRRRAGGEARQRRGEPSAAASTASGTRARRSAASWLAVVFWHVQADGRPRTPTCGTGCVGARASGVCAAEVQDAKEGRSRTSRAGRAAMAARAESRERRRTEAARLT